MKTRKLTAGEVSAMAKEIGLSYGLYVARYGGKLPGCAEPQPKTDAPRQKRCIYCGKIFETASGYKRYCSDECRITRHLKMQKEKAKQQIRDLPPRACAFCGKEFRPGKLRQKFCTPNCQKAAWDEHARKFRREQQAKAPFVTCGICGKTFQMCGNRKKYCSAECTREASRRASQMAYRKERGRGSGTKKQGGSPHEE